MPNDLNLNVKERICAVMVWGAIAAALTAIWWLPALAVAGGLVSSVILLNRDLYAFFTRKRGAFFTTGAVAMHLLYYVYSLATFAVVFSWCRVHDALRRHDARQPPTLSSG